MNHLKEKNRGRRAFAFLLPCFIFLTLVGMWNLNPHLGLRANKLLLSQLVAISFIGLVFIKNWWLKLFLLWTAIRTAMFCVTTSYTTLLIIFVFLMAYQVILDRIKPIDYRLVLNTICVVIILQTFWMTLNYFGIWFLTMPVGTNANIIPRLLHIDLSVGKYPAVGMLTHYNMASAMLVLSLPAFFRRRWRWFIPLILWGLWISQSAGGVIPAIVISVLFSFFYFKKHRRKIVLLSIMSILAFIVAYSQVRQLRLILDASGRYQMWGKMVKHLALNKPFIGIGIGQFKEVFPLFCAFIDNNLTPKHPFSHAHNEYIQLWIEYGAIGFALIMGFIVSLFRKIPRTYISLLAALGIIAGLLNSGVNFLFHTTGVFLLLLWVVILQKEKEMNYEESI